MVHYFWPRNYIEEKVVIVRSVKITPRGRRNVNTSRQSPQNRVHAAKNSLAQVLAA